MVDVPEIWSVMILSAENKYATKKKYIYLLHLELLTVSQKVSMSQGSDKSMMFKFAYGFR